MLKNVVVKIVQVTAGVFVGVVMNDTVNKYVVEPSQNINSKMGRPNKVSFFREKNTQYYEGRPRWSLFIFLFNNERRKRNETW